MVSRYHRDSPPYAAECAANAASIAEIPLEQFDDPEARDELIRRAMSGHDVYAYRPAFQPEWVVWVRQPSPAAEARFTPVAWAAQWRAGLQPELPLIFRGGALMHRTLERLDSAASTIVPLSYLAGMMLGTAAYFSGVVLDAGLAVGLALAVAVELHGFLEQRRVRALWASYTRAQDEDQRTRLQAELRAHVGILAGLVLFQAYNSLQFLSATWHPSTEAFVPVPVQLVLRALILPAGFLLSGALSPLTVNAGEELRHASRQMLRRTLRATLRQWNARIDRAHKQGHDLAPVAVALMEDAGDADGARRIRLIAAGLDTAEAPRPVTIAEISPDIRPDALSGPSRPPTGGGSPTALPAPRTRRASNQRRPAMLRLTPPPAEERIAAVLAAKPTISIRQLAKLAQVSQATASKWRKVRESQREEIAQ